MIFMRFTYWNRGGPCTRNKQGPAHAKGRLLSQRMGAPHILALPPLPSHARRLLFTSSPGTNSPIQRTFTGVSGFNIYQEVRGLHRLRVKCTCRL